MYAKYVKRPLDVVLCAVGLLILAVFLGIIAVAIKADSKGPVLFRQRRVGKGKRIFEIYKFRTMYADTPQDVPTHLLADPGARITRVGRFLRRTSFDELPQLFNILAGHMSIIGPRPALWNQDDLVAARDAYGANDVLPGLTGWAQINGRDELPIPVKAELDGYYVKHLSFLLDFKIFFRSATQIVRPRGVVEGEQEGPRGGPPPAG